MTTGYLYHEAYAWHDSKSAAGLLPGNVRAGLQPFQHLDTPDTKRRIHELVVVSGLVDHLTRLSPRPATREEVLRAHTPDYVDRVERESRDPRGGDAGDGISPFGQGGLDILMLAAGGAITMVEAVVTGRVDNGYALVRPSGHHAEPGEGMGMAYFANIVIAVRHARETLGLGRVAIVDYDAHHGSGTQHAFESDPDVLTISLHQENCFPPGSGGIDERGTGDGTGYNINVPLPPGTGDGGYDDAFRRVVVPAVRAFHPELLIVASGFDSCAMDPLARQLLTSGGYRNLVHQLREVAEEVCGGRVAMVHEGGYSPVYAPFCGLAVIEELSGTTTVDDPYLPLVSSFGGQGLQPHQQAVVDVAAAYVGDIG